MSAIHIHQQMPLDVRLRDDLTIANFYTAENRRVVNELTSFIAGSDINGVALVGETGLGKTHLLQAITQASIEQGQQAIYLPIKDWKIHGKDAIQGLESYGLICLDDLDQVASDREWEEAVFHLLNRAWALGHKVAISTSNVISEIDWALPDLQSRLGWGLVCRLKAMSDSEKVNALRHRASNRGIELPEEVGRYIINHLPRNMSVLFDLLETLDTASLQAKRKLTVPFIKSVLKEGGEC